MQIINTICTVTPSFPVCVCVCFIVDTWISCDWDGIIILIFFLGPLPIGIGVLIVKLKKMSIDLYDYSNNYSNKKFPSDQLGLKVLLSTLVNLIPPK